MARYARREPGAKITGKTATRRGSTIGGSGDTGLAASGAVSHTARNATLSPGEPAFAQQHLPPCKPGHDAQVQTAAWCVFAGMTDASTARLFPAFGAARTANTGATSIQTKHSNSITASAARRCFGFGVAQVMSSVYTPVAAGLPFAFRRVG